MANYKSFFVKKFYASLVAQARTLFNDARSQSERWVQAVTMPLETQMKDHKQQLQSRLDNLSKINEKSTGINEQLAELKAVAEALAKQREMIDGLLARVSRDGGGGRRRRHAARAVRADGAEHAAGAHGDHQALRLRRAAHHHAPRGARPGGLPRGGAREGGAAEARGGAEARRPRPRRRPPR